VKYRPIVFFILWLAPLRLWAANSCVEMIGITSRFTVELELVTIELIQALRDAEGQNKPIEIKLNEQVTLVGKVRSLAEEPNALNFEISSRPNPKVHIRVQNQRHQTVIIVAGGKRYGVKDIATNGVHIVKGSSLAYNSYYFEKLIGQFYRAKLKYVPVSFNLPGEEELYYGIVERFTDDENNVRIIVDVNDHARKLGIYFNREDNKFRITWNGWVFNHIRLLNLKLLEDPEELRKVQVGQIGKSILFENFKEKTSFVYSFGTGETFYGFVGHYSDYPFEAIIENSDGLILKIRMGKDGQLYIPRADGARFNIDSFEIKRTP
jgi:hypothetical protein